VTPEERARSRDEEYQTWLWGEALLLALLAAGLTLFLTYPTLREPYELAQVRIVLDTTVVLAATVVAVLYALRVLVEHRVSDLLLFMGFSFTAAASLGFAVVPALDPGDDLARPEGWAGVGGRLLGGVCIAAAPFVRGRLRKPRRALLLSLTAGSLALLATWAAATFFVDALPAVASRPSSPGTLPAISDQPLLRTATLAIQALLGLVALLGFWRRFRADGEDLDRWLALAATLAVFAEVHVVLTPFPEITYVSQGDFLRLLSFGVLLPGVWRAIRAAEFGRAVAEERARVAREIHDGLQQYLFSIATHITLLKPGQVSEETIDALRRAAAAAQQEARFAVLALSSASGSAPFDAALRRYVDVLTSDGELDVDLDIDAEVRLAPDEQIEVFRIVQEGLANVRKHANAHHADVRIGRRDGRRVLTVDDDGEGFEANGNGDAGQGLQNIRRRVSAIGGVFSVHSTPGRGTALEVVLRG
jgi:signal transduction histidine kinase